MGLGASVLRDRTAGADAVPRAAHPVGTELLSVPVAWQGRDLDGGLVGLFSWADAALVGSLYLPG